MELHIWQDFWQVFFYVASALFFVVIAAVAARGIGDLAAMIKALRQRRD